MKQAVKPPCSPPLSLLTLVCVCVCLFLVSSTGVHCQQMTGEYKRAALLLDGVVTVGAVNCEADQTLCHRVNIHQYPSLFLYPAGNARASQPER